MMIKRFSVTNFKGFRDEFVFDLSDTNSYEFNQSAIKNGIVNNALIYGPNNVGKSNLGIAIFDIVKNLTDKESSPELYHTYLNAYGLDKPAKFQYDFLISGLDVVYEYEKSSHDTILSEKLLIDKKIVASIDRKESNKATILFEGAENLQTNLPDKKLSLLKYIKNNSVLKENKLSKTFYGLFNFVEGMLFFRSLNDNNYIGLENGIKRVDEDIIENDNVQNFEDFLNKVGIKCKLTVEKESTGKKILAFDFGEYAIPFVEIASRGTNALCLFYFWLQRIKKKNTTVTFLFIDEFDAYYHHALSASVIEELKKTGVQFMLITHNTSVLTNDLLRPDCYFLMNNKQIKSLSKSTRKELREAHNIEKMYKANSFSLE